MRRHNLTQKDLLTYTPIHLPTYIPTYVPPLENTLKTEPPFYDTFWTAITILAMFGSGHVFSSL